MFCTSGSNLVILAWISHKLSCRLAHDWYTDWQTSSSMNKPTTWCMCGRVSLESSSYLFKTQPERTLAQICQTRIDMSRQISVPFITKFPIIVKPCGDVLISLSVHGLSKLWQMPFNMNKPTTRCKSAWVTDGPMNRGTRRQAMTISEGQNWPWLKVIYHIWQINDFNHNNYKLSYS